MFEVKSNLNVTAAITNLIENVQQNNNTLNNSLLLSSSAITPVGNSSMFLGDFVENTTAIVVDYAAQWLATTMSTLISSNIETTTPITTLLTPADNILNYTTPATLDTSYSNFTYNNNDTIINSCINRTVIISNNNINNTSTDATTNTSSFSNIRATYASMSSADLTEEHLKSTDDYDDCHPENPNFNCSRMDYILFILGPQAMPLYKSLLITILYGGIFITGFFGNILVCVVIVKHSAMHTATNYYLFSLAVSDLIYLIFGLPTEVFLYWHQYPYLFGLPFCKARAYISEASTYVSVLTIVAFSVERYLAICHPLHLYAMSGFKRALRIIALLWVVSFMGAIPFGIWTNIKYWCYPPDQTRIAESEFCGFDPPEHIPLFEVSSLVFFFIPMFLIFYFYGRMGAKIRSRTTQQLGVQQGSMHRESRHQQSRKAVIRMLAAVVLTFFICWLPFHIQRLWYVHGKMYKYYQEVNEWLFSMTGFAYYVTCTINPILYNVMSHRYRVAFKDILCGKRKNVYYNNGFARDQSSFRETTMASSLYNSSTYDRVHSVRVRSVKIVKNAKDRGSVSSNNILWKKSDYNVPMEKEIPENNSTNFTGTNAVVVCVDSSANGRTKVFTKNEAQESLLSKNNETCI